MEEVRKNGTLGAYTAGESAQALESEAEEAMDVSFSPSQPTHQGEAARTSPCRLARRA